MSDELQAMTADEALDVVVGRSVRRERLRDAALIIACLSVFVLGLIIYTWVRHSADDVLRTEQQQHVDDCRNAYSARITGANLDVLVSSVLLQNQIANALLLLKHGDLGHFDDQAMADAIARAQQGTAAYTAAVDDRDAWDVSQPLPCPITPAGTPPDPQEDHP